MWILMLIAQAILIILIALINKKVNMENELQKQVQSVKKKKKKKNRSQQIGDIPQAWAEAAKAKTKVSLAKVEKYKKS